MRFKVSRNGIVIGEFDFLEVVDALAEGRLSGKDYFWTIGMTEWMLLSDFAEYNKKLVLKSPQTSSPAKDNRSAPSSRVKKRSLFKGVDAASASATPPSADLLSEVGSSHVVSEPRCPSCASKSVQACGMGFASGTRTSESLGISSRGRAYFRTGRSSSLLASALAPPAKGGPNIIFVILFLGGMLGSALWYATYAPEDWRPVNQAEKWFRLTMALSALIGGLWGIFKGSISSDQEHAEAMKKWEKQWFCKKCGAIFTPSL